jgi:ketosteroid isomerase-like protein
MAAPPTSYREDGMTKTAGLTTALAYHRAWTSKDLDGAMEHVAEDIVCDAPGGTIVGVNGYRQFLGGFMQKLTGHEMIAAFGDDQSAMLMYYPQTAVVTDAATAEYFTIRDGKIAKSILVFDRPSFAPPTS